MSLRLEIKTNSFLFRTLSILLFFFTLGTLAAQKTEKDLLKKTWYSSYSVGSTGFVLSADNADKPLYEIRFSRTGRLVLKHLRRRSVDSTCHYIVKKQKLIVTIDAKDSVATFEYKLKKLHEKKAYQLRLTYSSRYVKRKGDDTITLDQFTLVYRKKRKTMQYGEALTVFYQSKARRNDSIDYAVWGQFVGYIADTLLIDADQYVEHNFYRKYTDTLHYIAPLLIDTVIRIKVPVKKISGIYAQREPFTSYCSGITILGMSVGLGCVATSIALPDNQNSLSGSLAQVGVYSLLTIPVSFGAGMAFGTQKFLLDPSKKGKKVWKIERHMPHISQSGIRTK